MDFLLHLATLNNNRVGGLSSRSEIMRFKDGNIVQPGNPVPDFQKANPHD
jgi:hypothetical protein